MAKLQEKRKVVELRKQGKSYSEILKEIKVSKSSLSLWLKNIPLTEGQILGLKKKKERAVERYIETMRLKRQTRTNGYYENQIKKWIPLSKREKFIAGLFLYWGEGNKASRNVINIANTDPSVIKFSIYWIEKCLGLSRNHISLKLHLYNDMNVKDETKFWMNILGVDKSRFKKPYIKKSSRGAIDQKGFGHGTCTVMVFNTIAKENVMMAIKAISDNFTLGV